MDKKTALIILDGWGIGAKDDSDGVHLAKTPFFDHLMKNYPNAQLKTCLLYTSPSPRDS